MLTGPMPITLFIPLLIACTGASGTDSDDSAADSADTSPGTLALSFQMEEDLIVSMDAPPVGTFYGSIYAEEDATAAGPVENAVPLEDLSADLDLTDHGGPTGVLYTTQPLDAGVVWVLGCLDVDGDGCGDEGDPITVPNDNKVVVATGAETPFTVYMSMLRPSF